MARAIGFGRKEGEEEEIGTELEKYIGMYVSINARGANHIGRIANVERDHLSLLPALVSEGFPGPIYRYRIEEKTPARIELPVDCVYPIRKEYLNEIVEHTRKELEKKQAEGK